MKKYICNEFFNFVFFFFDSKYKFFFRFCDVKLSNP